MLSHISTPHPRQRSWSRAIEVTIVVQIGPSESALCTDGIYSNQAGIWHGERLHNSVCGGVVDQMDFLQCPMCDFAVHPIDEYTLQLHFEQVHTTDSPFIIEDDPEPLPPALPPRPSSKRKQVGDTPSSDEGDNSVVCPEPHCGEIILLSDFNDHLDFHTAETLSFDETTGKYHSHHSSATMHKLATSYHDTAASECDSSVATSVTSKHHGSHRRRLKKHSQRQRSNTSSSEKSVISRSISTFNPFANSEKTVKPPNKSARLGVSYILANQLAPFDTV